MDIKTMGHYDDAYEDEAERRHKAKEKEASDKGWVKTPKELKPIFKGEYVDPKEVNELVRFFNNWKPL